MEKGCVSFEAQPFLLKYDRLIGYANNQFHFPIVIHVRNGRTGF